MDNSHRGISAKQISLRYRKGGRGAWSAVALTGDTANGGALTASLEARPSTFPANSNAGYQFQPVVHGSLPHYVSDSLGFSVSEVEMNSANGCATMMYNDELHLEVR